MKKTLKEQVDAMSAFEAFCQKNISIWAVLVAFANLVTALGLKIQSIITTESQQEENNKGVTRTKKQLKTDMANEAVAVSQALQAYAIDIGDTTLYELMSMVFSTIMKGKDTKAISTCQLVFDTASGFSISALKPYGISAAVLSTLETAISDFTSGSPATRNVITNKTVLTKNLTQLVSEGNNIMRDQLLKIARQYKTSNPDFYNGLVANAKVIRYSVHAKIRITAVTGDPAFAVEGATMTISGTNLSGLTNAKGKLTISRVPEGLRDVTVMKDGIGVSFQINFQRGHSHTMVANLLAKFEVPSVKKAKV